MMRLPVYTELLRVRRMVWHIGRMALPRPITVVQLLVAAAEVLILLWALTGGLLPVPDTVPAGPLVVGLYAVVALGGVHLAGRPVLDGLRLDQAGLGLLRHFCQPREWAGGQPAVELADPEDVAAKPASRTSAPFADWPLLRPTLVSGNGHAVEVAR